MPALDSRSTLSEVGGNRSPSVVLSYGMGLDSTALLLRWLFESGCRDFALEDLVVCTSMTGDEFSSTARDVSDLVLPLLREHRVRFVQVGRAERKTTKAGGGVVVLDDSRQPSRLHAEGRYSLGAEMASAGTVPQLGGIRSCSIHAKGNCLDPVIARITSGQPYRHAIGFEAGETRRAAKDRAYDTELRTGWYPLVEWGWTRQDCQDYVEQATGRAWEKSACVFCPFAMATAAGRAALVERYRREPGSGAWAMFLESVARSLNPAQTLIAGSSVADLVAEAGLAETLALHEARMAGAEHSLYEVRRLSRPSRSGGRALVARSVRVHASGSRDEMAARLGLAPGEAETGPDGIRRHYLRRREDDGLEHLYVAAPSGVEPKQRPGFEQWWDQATGATIF